MTTSNLPATPKTTETEASGQTQPISREPNKNKKTFSFLTLDAQIRRAMPKIPPAQVPRVFFLLPHAPNKVSPSAKVYGWVGSKRRLVVKIPNWTLKPRHLKQNIQWRAGARPYRSSSHNGVAKAIVTTKHSWAAACKAKQFVIIAANGAVKPMYSTGLHENFGTGRVIRVNPFKFRKRLWKCVPLSLKSKHIHDSWSRFWISQLAEVSVRRVKNPDSYENPILKHTKDHLLEENYLALKDAATDSKYSETELLKFACDGKINLIVKVRSGIDLLPFDTYTETKGEQYLNCYPELLALEPSDCMHIERDGSTERSDFRKGYMFSFGRLQPIFPGYGNPHFRNEKCVWRAFLQGKREKIKITPECLYVTNDDLQNFIYENRKISGKQQTSTKCNTPPAYTEAMNKQLITIVETAALTGKPMDIHQLPCTRRELYDLVIKLDANLECNSYRTFTSYIQGICAVKKGRPAKGRPNPFMKLFPEYYYPVKTTHLIEK